MSDSHSAVKKSLKMWLRPTCSAVLPTTFPPSAPWDLRISLRPVPAPWRTWETKINKITHTWLFFEPTLPPLIQLTLSSENKYCVFTSHEGLKRSLQSSSQKLSRGHSFVLGENNNASAIWHCHLYQLHRLVSDCLPPLIDWSYPERCRLGSYALLLVAQWLRWWFFFVSPQVHLQNCRY